MNQALLRTDDEYYTPKHVWEDIQEYIPKDKTIWEAFKGDGRGAEYLKELGFTVVCDDDDFFSSASKGDIVVTNPPFSKSKQILERLVRLGQPFILILPCSKITTQYVRTLFKDSFADLKIIVPPKRIHFDKPGMVKSKCSFDCFYWCWKVPTMEHLPNLNFIPRCLVNQRACSKPRFL
jgi:hypothetical protein